MVTNTNPTSPFEEFFDTDNSAGVSDLSSADEVLGNLEKRRDNAIHGGTNCIPLPFVKFRSEIPGVEQSQYVIITANQKVGKTQLGSFIYVYNVLDYCYEHPDKCSAHIIYVALEESVQKVYER